MSHALRAAPAGPDLAELRRDVRDVTRRAHRLARAEGGGVCQTALAAVFETWLGRGDARERVVCFAAAAQAGFDVRRHAECCRQVADGCGSTAIRTLFLAASRRQRSRWDEAARRLDVDSATVAAAARVRAMPASGTAPTCAHCERLRRDSRRDGGHFALQPVGDLQWRSVGGSALCETRAYRCRVCRANWTEHRSSADPFVGWSIGRP